MVVIALLAPILTLVSSAPAQAANTNSVSFSVERGFITGPITVELSAGAGQTILYSTTWGDQWMAADFTPVAQTYDGPIQISGSTQIRAMAIGDEHAVSHTYLDISSYSAGDRALIESYPTMVTTGSSFGSRAADARTIVEFWHPNGDGDSAPAGIRNRQGGVGQTGDFRLYFRDEYGDGRLDYELFPNEPAGAQTSGGYDKVNFHGGSQDAFGYSWSYNGCTPGQGTLMRDRFFQRVQRQLNGDGVSGEYYLMFQRGNLVGLKNAEDVPQQGFMDEHFGGGKDNYGLWTWYSRDLLPGNAYASANSIDDFYSMMDVTNYIDYLIIQWFSDNRDWGSANRNNNVVVGGQIDGPYYHWTWDSHATDPGCGRTWGGYPIYTYNPLSNTEFRMEFADRALLHFTDDGVMTSPQLLSTWDSLAGELAPGVPLVANVNTWNGAQQSMRSRVGSTSAGLYAWMQQNGYASTVVPVAYSLPAGDIPSGSTIQLSGGDEIWFTVDGTDPRATGGAVSGTALRYSGDIAPADGTVQMLARVKSGNNWSAAVPVIYQVGAPTLQITEATVEYVEITNTGVTPINLEYFRLQGDVRFKFDYNRSPIIAPGQTVIIAEDSAVFAARWGTEPFGQFLGRINGNELLRLVDTELNTQYQVSSPLVVDGVPGSFVRPEPEAADPPGLILNEWNAVTSSNSTDDPDPRLGSVPGNGGDWFEVVTVNDTDVRGWRLEASDADSLGTIVLSQNALWSDLPAGVIITFSQDPVIAEDGTVYDTDVSLDPDTNDWWIHVVTGTANPYTNQTTFPASADNWSLRIANAVGTTQWGPVGEGLGALLSGVSQSEVGELEAHPAPGLDPVTAPYDDGKGSTFGAPNAFDGTFQNFFVLRTGANPGENTNCDATLDIVDALLIAQFGANNRSDFGRCPLDDPATQLNAAAGDINLDGTTNIVDALLISQCAIFIDNGHCPPPAAE